MADLFHKKFGLVSCRVSTSPPPKKNSRPKFTPEIVGIPLPIHFLEPKKLCLRARPMLIRATFFPRGTAEWLARVELTAFAECQQVTSDDFAHLRE